ncbi:MAG: hypothetical protein KHY23_11980, partial [Clostridium sp.]|nr:hypothetical protein [Clostridium sp.]
PTSTKIPVETKETLNDNANNFFNLMLIIIPPSHVKTSALYFYNYSYNIRQIFSEIVAICYKIMC